MKKIGDNISVSGMGVMGAETYIGEVIGTTHDKYIIDFKRSDPIEQRF